MGYTYYGFCSEPKIIAGKVDTSKAVAEASFKSDLYPIKQVKWIATDGISRKYWSIEKV